MLIETTPDYIDLIQPSKELFPKQLILKRDKWIIFPKEEFRSSFGFKIHISCSIQYFENNINELLEFLIKLNVPFKIPASRDIAFRLNHGIYGESQVGKIITIYVGEEILLVKKIAEFVKDTNGPIIPFEIPINSYRSVFIRHGAYNIECRYDLFGRPVPVFKNEQGEIIDDKREESLNVDSLPNDIKDFRINEFDEISKHNFLPLKLISKSGKSKVYKAIRVSDFTKAVVKVVPNRMSGDIFGVDSTSKINREYEILNFLSGHQLEFIPTPYFFKNFKDISVLVTKDFIKSIPFDKLSREKRIELFPKLVDCIKRVHNEGVIHGDIKGSNILIGENNNVFIIDFETAQTRDRRYKENYGTKGFLITDENYDKLFEEIDYLSLVSVLIGIYLDNDPSVLPYDNSKRIKCLELCGYTEQSQIIKSLIENPQLIIQQSTLEKIVDISLKKKDIKFLNTDLRKLDFSSKLISDFSIEDSRWLSNHLYSDFELNSLNMGSVGSLFSLLLISTGDNEPIPMKINECVSRIRNFDYGSDSNGLYTGNSGLAITLFLFGIVSKDKNVQNYARTVLFDSITNNNNKEDDLFSGSAGIIYTCLLFNSLDENRLYLDSSKKIYDSLINKVQYLESTPYWNPSGLLENSNNPFSGLAHGAIGIAFSIYHYAHAVNDKKGIELSLKVLKSSYQLIDKDKNTLRRYVKEGKQQYTNAHYWCHGITG
ncbi:MAG: hypothetical protein OEW75_16945, partial [Cyclobacteriaceae bacterium]|nr:hypothetical protein [Cyclobacteriaceae bacterium]